MFLLSISIALLVLSQNAKSIRKYDLIFSRHDRKILNLWESCQAFRLYNAYGNPGVFIKKTFLGKNNIEFLLRKNNIDTHFHFFCSNCFYSLNSYKIGYEQKENECNKTGNSVISEANMFHPRIDCVHKCMHFTI